METAGSGQPNQYVMIGLLVLLVLFIFAVIAIHFVGLVRFMMAGPTGRLDVSRPAAIAWLVVGFSLLFGPCALIGQPIGLVLAVRAGSGVDSDSETDQSRIARKTALWGSGVMCLGLLIHVLGTVVAVLISSM